MSDAIGGAELPLPVTLSHTGDDMLEIDIAAQAGLPDALVWLVTFLDRADVAIERGENEGKTIAYTQIVTGRQMLGMWEPETGTHLKLPLSEVLTAPSNGARRSGPGGADGLPGPMLGRRAASALDRLACRQKKLPPLWPRAGERLTGI